MTASGPAAGVDDQMAILEAMQDACESGDMDAYLRLLPSLELPPETLMGIKNSSLKGFRGRRRYGVPLDSCGRHPATAGPPPPRSGAGA